MQLRVREDSADGCGPTLRGASVDDTTRTTQKDANCGSTEALGGPGKNANSSFFKKSKILQKNSMNDFGEHVIF